MNPKVFSSDSEKDCIEIFINNRQHKAMFKILKYDDLSENMKILHQVIEYLKKGDIKWLHINNEHDKEFTIPMNALCDINNKRKTVVCHIEDFENFYLTNIKNFIDTNMLSIDMKTNEDGWTKVFDKKKERKKKLLKVQEELNNLGLDWSKSI